MPSSPEPRPPDRPGHRERTAFLCVAGFFACCSLRLLTTGYLELDDLGRVQLGYNLWAADGRLLTFVVLADLAGVDTGDDMQAGSALKAAVEALPAPGVLQDVQAAVDYAARAGKVGIVGFCWGGLLTWRAAATARPSS